MTHYILGFVLGLMNVNIIFMKVGDWAILQFPKRFSISSIMEVTKRLIQWYVIFILITKVISQLLYKISILIN